MKAVFISRVKVALFYNNTTTFILLLRELLKTNLLWTKQGGKWQAIIILHNDEAFIKKCPFQMYTIKLAKIQDEAENLMLAPKLIQEKDRAAFVKTVTFLM